MEIFTFIEDEREKDVLDGVDVVRTYLATDSTLTIHSMNIEKESHYFLRFKVRYAGDENYFTEFGSIDFEIDVSDPCPLD